MFLFKLKIPNVECTHLKLVQRSLRFFSAASAVISLMAEIAENGR